VLTPCTILPKGGKVQNLMHHFKYNGMHQIGNILGNIAGAQLNKNPKFAAIDILYLCRCTKAG
jgi:hypothetical protein